MAKDDYHVIVYQILAYLYKCLKKGEDVDEGLLQHGSPLMKINRRYWEYIITNIVEQGFVSGITVKQTLDVKIIENLDRAQITPTGIEYLCDNSFMAKAKEFAMNAKDIIPMILK